LRAKVLIAEDDAIVALDLQGMVSRLGYDVVAIVENGPTAIAAVQRFQPDIILLDMVLTGRSTG
jgi:CheY-like chemotaxis protein